MKANSQSNEARDGDPSVDSGYWRELQEKVAVRSIEDLAKTLDETLEKLESKYASYVTRNSLKRDLRR